MRNQQKGKRFKRYSLEICIDSFGETAKVVMPKKPKQKRSSFYKTYLNHQKGQNLLQMSSLVDLIQ